MIVGFANCGQWADARGAGSQWAEKWLLGYLSGRASDFMLQIGGLNGLWAW
jgi:hypothetical protein